jgi:hypothetical protein
MFDEDPGKDYALSEVLARNKPAGKAQQRFRKLVATIEREREELRGWQAYRQRYNQTQRTRKNQLMQRVNQAYEANDLLTLLGPGQNARAQRLAL